MTDPLHKGLVTSIDSFHRNAVFVFLTDFTATTCLICTCSIS